MSNINTQTDLKNEQTLFTIPLYLHPVIKNIIYLFGTPFKGKRSDIGGVIRIPLGCLKDPENMPDIFREDLTRSYIQHYHKIGGVEKMYEFKGSTYKVDFHGLDINVPKLFFVDWINKLYAVIVDPHKSYVFDDAYVPEYMWNLLRVCMENDLKPLLSR